VIEVDHGIRRLLEGDEVAEVVAIGVHTDLRGIAGRRYFFAFIDVFTGVSISGEAFVACTTEGSDSVGTGCVGAAVMGAQIAFVDVITALSLT
tara:strand:+ start:816 stop:1094 length:279 start_codon:yes stop_codon:yes gene_type:complete